MIFVAASRDGQARARVVCDDKRATLEPVLLEWIDSEACYFPTFESIASFNICRKGLVFSGAASQPCPLSASIQTVQNAPAWVQAGANLSATKLAHHVSLRQHSGAHRVP